MDYIRISDSATTRRKARLKFRKPDRDADYCLAAQFLPRGVVVGRLGAEQPDHDVAQHADN